MIKQAIACRCRLQKHHYNINITVIYISMHPLDPLILRNSLKIWKLKGNSVWRAGERCHCDNTRRIDLAQYRSQRSVFQVRHQTHLSHKSGKRVLEHKHTNSQSSIALHVCDVTSFDLSQSCCLLIPATRFLDRIACDATLVFTDIRWNKIPKEFHAVSNLKNPSGWLQGSCEPAPLAPQNHQNCMMNSLSRLTLSKSFAFLRVCCEFLNASYSTSTRSPQEGLVGTCRHTLN